MLLVLVLVLLLLLLPLLLLLLLLLLLPLLLLLCRSTNARHTEQDQQTDRRAATPGRHPDGERRSPWTTADRGLAALTGRRNSTAQCPHQTLSTAQYCRAQHRRRHGCPGTVTPPAPLSGPTGHVCGLAERARGRMPQFCRRINIYIINPPNCPSGNKTWLACEPRVKVRCTAAKKVLVYFFSLPRVGNWGLGIPTKSSFFLSKGSNLFVRCETHP